MGRKKRVLWVGEASFLNTGYSTYAHEVLKRLHATDKFLIHELGCYGPWRDERAAGVPWAFMTAMPNPDDQGEVDRYNSDPLNQFGQMRFEEACLACRPDVVLDIRDWWMLEFEERSPFRPYYHWTAMPTCDAEPQDEGWVSTYLNMDAVFTYSDWAQEVLRRQSGGRIKLCGTAPPGADLDTFRPAPDRPSHRRNLGVEEDCLLVGTVMRNQRRKLYPDLIQAFALFLKEAPAELAKRSYLYLHTSWPDVGWDVPRIVVEEGVSGRCLFTYICRDCGAVFPSFFQDAKAVCRRCGAHEATLPNSHSGVSRGVLAAIVNLFDVYVQYANSEGFGMPMAEAAACGVPVMATDYSAMSDVVRKLGGYPVRVQRMFREPETHCWRALPDNRDFVEKLISFLLLPGPVRARKGYEARRGVEEHYTYERTAKVWEGHLDSVVVRDLWDSPPRIHRPAEKIPEGLTNEELVRWGIVHVAGRPELADSYTALRMVRDLNWGACLPQAGGLYFNEMSSLGAQPRYQPFGRDDALKALYNLCEQRNHWERRRAGDARR